MDFEVVYVGDDELAGKDWAIVRAGRRFIAFIKESRVTAALLTEMWEAFTLSFKDRPGVPRPRWEFVPAVWEVDHAFAC